MRKILITYLLWLYAASSVVSANSIKENAPLVAKQGASDRRAAVIEIVRSQIGVRELTGNNDGVQVQAYLATVGLKGNHAWCAAFVNWNYEKCGIKTPKSGWVPNWFMQNRLVYKLGKIIKRLPMMGDVFGIYFASKKRLAHIGFIESWTEGQYATCIEGNTNGAGSREGNGVYRKYRLKSQIHSVADYISE